MSRNPRPKFTFLGHATVRCDLPGGEVVLIDPWVGQNPSCPDEHKTFERLDAVLITHGHWDHIDDAVELCQQHRPVVVANIEICDWLARQGVERCSAMNTGGTQEILDGALAVTQVGALHSSGIKTADGMIYGGDPCGYVARLATGYTFYHAGDTALFSDMQLIADLYRPQLAFLPIGDHFTMDPRQAALACKFLEVPQAVPIHWGTFPLLTGTPEMLRQRIEEQGVNCELVVLEPGESY